MAIFHLNPDLAQTLILEVRSSGCPVCGILIYYLRKEGRDLVISQETVANGVENTMCVDFPYNMELKYNLIMHSLKKKKKPLESDYF